MAEELTLTTPATKPPVLSYKVVRLNMSMPDALISITVNSNTGDILIFGYSGQVAIDYIKFINTGNFSVTSLQKRILQRLSQEGKLPPGNVTGVPE